MLRPKLKLSPRRWLKRRLSRLIRKIRPRRWAIGGIPRTAGLQTSQAENTNNNAQVGSVIDARTTVTDASMIDNSQPVTAISGRDDFRQPAYAQYV